MSLTFNLTAGNITRIIRQHARMIAVVTGLTGMLAVLSGYLVPPIYVSQTLILIRRQKIPEDLVKPVVTDDVTAQLATMKQQILSRSNLEPIISQFNLAPHAGPMDARVEEVRKSITITPLGADFKHPMNAFTVACKASSARTAQSVCAEITALFVNQNLSAQRESAFETNDFLKQQLDLAKSNLATQDQNLAKLEQRETGMLPSEQSANMTALQSLLTQQDAATLSLAQMQQEERSLEAQPAYASMPSEPALGRAMVAAYSPLDAQIQDLEGQEEALLQKYTSDYPEVVALESRIDALKQQKARSAAAAPVPASPAPRARSSTPGPLQGQLAAANRLAQVRTQIQDGQQQLAAIQRKIALYESRLDASPEVQEKLSRVTRDHNVAMQFYKELQQKMDDSSLAANLENRQQGEQFDLVDPANLPESPIFPNHRLFALGGFAGGLFLAVALSFLLEFQNPILMREGDLFHATEIPILAALSFNGDLPSFDAGQNPNKSAKLHARRRKKGRVLAR